MARAAESCLSCTFFMQIPLLLLLLLLLCTASKSFCFDKNTLKRTSA